MTTTESNKTTILKPGTLVSLKTVRTGGVFYTRKVLTAEQVAKAQAKATKKAKPGAPVPEVARWETTRVIEDPEAYEASVKARSKARGFIVAVCAATSFGLICPEGQETELEQAMAQAQATAAAHNAAWPKTHVDVFIIRGKIAGTDQEAVRAITGELRELISDMNGSIDRLDPKAIRDAATRAQEISRMLSAEAAEKVGAAVKAARKAARTIVSKVEKKGEKASVVLADIQRGAIENARVAFLDLEGVDAPDSAEDAMPAIPLGRVASVDLGEGLDLAANGEE